MASSIGVVGLGYWGPNLIRNFSANPGWTVRYGCDLAPAHLARLRSMYPAVVFTDDLARLLDDPDLAAIAIATPLNTHYAIAKAALERGKHVLIEKPMAASVAEADELIAIAAARGCQILIDHTFVFTGAVRRIREMVLSGELGDLYSFDSTRINLGLIQPDTNVLWDLAIHDLSILGQIADLKTLRTVSAHGSRHYGAHEEIGHLHLSMAGGIDAHVHVSWLSPVKLRQTIIGGTRKMVVFDDIQPSEKVRVYDSGVQRHSLGGEPQGDPFFPIYRTGDVLIPKLDTTEALRLEAQHFLDVVEGRVRPWVSGEDGRMILHILELANQSLRDGRPVVC